MPNEDATHLNQLRQSFVFVVISITVLVATIMLVNYLTIEKEHHIRETLQKSAEQRMLSQRIAFLSEMIMHNKGEAGFPPQRFQDLQALSQAITDMKENHVLLIEHHTKNQDDHPDDVEDIYFGIHKNLDQKIKNFIRHAEYMLALLKTPLKDEQQKILNKTYTRVQFIAEHDLLESLNRIVKIHETEAEELSFIFKMIEPLLLLLAVATLAFLWVRVFNPLDNQLHMTLKSLRLLREESAREKHRMDLATRGTSTGVWDWDIQTGTFYWSAVLQDILGIKKEAGKIYNTDFVQTLIYDESREIFNKAVREHLKNRTPFHCEAKLIHPTKKYIWVSFKGQALWNDDGIAYRMLGSMEDITKKRQAENEKSIYAQAIESSGLPFAIIEIASQKNNFIYTTQAFRDLTDYKEEKLKESNLNIFTGPETSMGDLDAIDYAIDQNKGMQTKILSYRIDGSSFWNEITLQPIFTTDNKKASYYAIIFNDLTESILREEREVTRQRNESLGELAASVAHEINNLLMPMTMTKDILEGELKEDCDPFAHEQIDTIVEYANQAKEIVTGILTFARKETGTLEETNIYNLLKSSVAFISNLLTSKTSVLIEEPKNELIKTKMAMVNITEFRQIITNLAKNAEHAFNGKNGKITISFSLKSVSNNERNDFDLRATEFVIIHFADNGCGISKKNLSRIFEPLFTTRSVGRGTGLGLSVVHGIIRSWGGTIQVESTEDVGTKFDLYIPIKQDYETFDYLEDIVDEDEDTDLDKNNNKEE